MGISTISHVKTHITSYLGYIIPPGQTFIGAKTVNTKVPMKTIVKVIVNHISKKLSAGDDIFDTLKNKFKQEELRIVYKSSIINTK
jgi:6-phosphogluconate dehydrogenase (decarboxylating)